jgi:hypothetical protein
VEVEVPERKVDDGRGEEVGHGLKRRHIADRGHHGERHDEMPVAPLPPAREGHRSRCGPEIRSRGPHQLEEPQLVQTLDDRGDVGGRRNPADLRGQLSKPLISDPEG